MASPPTQSSQRCLLTCTNHLLPSDTGWVYLCSELEHSLVGVLIGVGVHVRLQWLQLFCSGKERGLEDSSGMGVLRKGCP